MAKNKRILVAVDNSPASRKAVRYVADMVGGMPDFHVGLIHLKLPPKMLEWGGSEDPEREERTSVERADAYQEMEADSIRAGQDLLQGLEDILAARRIDVAARLVQFEEPLEPKQITSHLLKTAGEQDFGTLVVGRHSFSALRRLFAHYVGEELVRAGRGITLWVVE